MFGALDLKVHSITSTLSVDEIQIYFMYQKNVKIDKQVMSKHLMSFLKINKRTQTVRVKVAALI